MAKNISKLFRLLSSVLASEALSTHSSSQWALRCCWADEVGSRMYLPPSPPPSAQGLQLPLGGSFLLESHCPSNLRQPGAKIRLETQREFLSLREGTLCAALGGPQEKVHPACRLLL